MCACTTQTCAHTLPAHTLRVHPHRLSALTLAHSHTHHRTHRARTQTHTHTRTHTQERQQDVPAVLLGEPAGGRGGGLLARQVRPDCTPSSCASADCRHLGLRCDAPQYRILNRINVDPRVLGGAAPDGAPGGVINAVAMRGWDVIDATGAARKGCVAHEQLPGSRSPGPAHCTVLYCSAAYRGALCSI